MLAWNSWDGSLGVGLGRGATLLFQGKAQAIWQGEMKGGIPVLNKGHALGGKLKCMQYGDHSGNLNHEARCLRRLRAQAVRKGLWFTW